jgi:peptide/nickel transport system permease protein
MTTNALPDRTARRKEMSADAKEKYYQATQWQLIWWKFRKHQLAKVAIVVLGLLYFGALTSEFVSPYGSATRLEGFEDCRPTPIHLLADGKLVRPFIYKMESELNPQTFRMTYTENTTQRFPIYFFAPGEPYVFWGIFPTDIHLFTTDGAPIMLFGTDRLARDLFSRTIYGSRISLSIGLVGVALAFFLGLTIGGISGYFGGTVDLIIQRIIEFILSLPTIPLWMALSASLPRVWSVPKTYFFITIILSLLSWCTLARQVRGKLLSLREEDFVVSARLVGSGGLRIMRVHLFPSFTSHLIVTLTLMIPAVILGETALSFLGLGMQPPAVSWGVLLQDAQNIVTIAHHPWQLVPVLFVIATVLMYNFLGDGLRDAADPYSV